MVTYHPGAYLAGHLAALRAEVEAVVVIDNGSPDAAEIERVAVAAGCRFIGNAANLGIATALNQAARLALGEGYDWLATFDQDSLVPAGAIAGLLDLYAAHPHRERIAVLAMAHRDRNLGRDYHQRFDVMVETPDWRVVRTAITSGAMLRLADFARVGPFDDALFIDRVDHDYCLRCRGRGLIVVEGRHQVLEHAIGEATAHKLLWRRVSPTHHSPTRRYYITRNGLEICRRYLLGDFLWVAYEIYSLLGVSLTALIFEDQRPAKVRAMLQGAWHFVIRRFGPRPGG